MVHTTEQKSEHLIGRQNNEWLRWWLTSLIVLGYLWGVVEATKAGIITEKPGSRNDLTGLPTLEFHPEKIIAPKGF